MEHTDKTGASKIVSRCTLPLTGERVVHRIITDLAVIDVTATGLELRECAPGITASDVRAATAAPLLCGRTDTGHRASTAPRRTTDCSSEGIDLC
jgi:3-oxoacid CoA-transferase subunit B